MSASSLVAFLSVDAGNVTLRVGVRDCSRVLAWTPLFLRPLLPVLPRFILIAELVGYHRNSQLAPPHSMKWRYKILIPD
jgi:hypothetical protein